MESQISSKGAIENKITCIEIWGSWSTFNYIKAEVISLSALSTSLMFAESFVHNKDLSNKPAIHLRIRMQGIQDLNNVTGIVTNARSAKGFITLSIQFSDSSAVKARLPGNAFSAFNRRVSPRAILPSNPRTEIRILNTTSNQDQNAALMDISEGGLRMMFYGSDCPEGGDRLKLNFVLPDYGYKFSLIARVIKNSCLASVKSCGVQFSTIGDDYKTQQLEIRKYVRNRLAELAEIALSDYSD
jgi:hypothetical protein